MNLPINSSDNSFTILTRVRNKAAHILNTTNKGVNTLFFGEKEWEEFAEFAERNWMVVVHPHQRNYLLGISIYKDIRFASGIYTAEEAEAAMQQRAKASAVTDVGVVVTPSPAATPSAAKEGE